MGQYQQWLQYQEIQKRLSSQAEDLEAELRQLQNYVDQFEQQHTTAPSLELIDNPIVQVLIAHLSSQAVSAEHTMHSVFQETNPDEPGDSISPALRNWGELPDFEPYEIKESRLLDNQAPTFLNHPEIELLPEDMMAFFEEHEQTDPQLELPWWLRKITISSKDEQSSKPIDHNTVRTNRLVQRWVERWGRQSPIVLRADEQMGEKTYE